MYLHYFIFSCVYMLTGMLAFESLADPTRQRMIDMLASGERSAGELGEAFDLSQPAVSHHLKRLREAGLVRARVDGQRRVYSLETAKLEAMEVWLREKRTFWNRRMDALEAAVRNGPRKGGLRP